MGAGTGTGGDGDLLARMGTDGQRWADEFCDRYMVAPKHDDYPDDEGARSWQRHVMMTWFANAIEAGRSTGYDAGYNDGYDAVRYQ